MGSPVPFWDCRRNCPAIERILFDESNRNDGLTPKALISANESRSEFISAFASGFCSFTCDIPP